ncbi:glutamate racemase [Mycobacterium sp. pUA109]|uniref:glutamate racemase n=1 Tax=Mycobacterium sp. pUA109 TaxID=3238982 RepID=UPI00351B20A3
MTALGVVDWGIGGIGLVQALDRVAPGLPVLYWSDSGALPYGRMRTGELTARLSAVLDRLAEMGASEAVLACNAASTVVGHLGAAAIPVHGIIDCGVASVPDAVARVGVIGGRRTIAAGHYRRGLTRPGRVVLSRVAQPLSAHIEAGRAGSAEFRADLTRILAPLRGVQALVLACTHYPAARRWFSDVLPDALLVDPVQRLAAGVADRYPQARRASRPAERTFVTTGDPAAMRRAALAAWGVEVAAFAVRPR